MTDLTTPAVGDNRLAALAADIRAAHADIGSLAGILADKVIATGHLLIEAKALVKHGQWLLWLKESCGFSEQTARNYIRAARYGKTAKIADMTDRAAETAMTAIVGHPHFVEPPSEPPAAGETLVIGVLRQDGSSGFPRAIVWPAPHAPGFYRVIIIEHESSSFLERGAKWEMVGYMLSHAGVPEVEAMRLNETDTAEELLEILRDEP